MGKKIITINFAKNKVSIRGGKKTVKGTVKDFFGEMTSGDIVDIFRKNDIENKDNKDVQK